MIINNTAFFAIIISVISAIIGQYFIKKLVALESINRALNVMFFFCFGLSVVISLLFGAGQWRVEILVVGLGFVNALTGCLSWRAIKVTLSQTMLFWPLTGFIGVFLAALFLGEWNFFNLKNLSGVLTWLGALGLLGSVYFFRGSGRENKQIKKIWLWCVIGQCILGGVICFLMKYFALQAVAKTDFIFSWYLGAFVGSFIPLILKRDFKIRLPQKGLWPSYLLLSIATLVSVLTSYWSLELAPATFVLPISQFLNVLGAVLVGLFIFHERKSFSSKDWVGTVIGFASGVLLIGGMSLIR